MPISRVVFPEFLLVVPLIMLLIAILQERDQRPEKPRHFLWIVFGSYAIVCVALFVLYPDSDAAEGLPISRMSIVLGLFLGAFGFYQMRTDHPEEISILFRLPLYLGSGGIVLIGAAIFMPPEVGVGLLAAGFVLGLIGCWMFADSGIRGVRFFYAGVIASLAGPAVIMGEYQAAGAVLILSYCLLPLFFLLPDASRKYRMEEERREFEKRGEFGRPVMLNETGSEEVVVVRRTSKSKRSKRRRPSPAAKPVIIAREPEEEESEPVFGEGVLATEPGRQGQVRIDPWTGAAIQEDSEDSPSGMALQSDEEFPEMDELQWDEESIDPSEENARKA